VETSGKTSEEIDAMLDGTKHSAVPDLEDVRRGKVDDGDILGEEVARLEDDYHAVEVSPAKASGADSERLL
jgi:hypothetical protein